MLLIVKAKLDIESIFLPLLGSKNKKEEKRVTLGKYQILFVSKFAFFFEVTVNVREGS